MMVTRSLLALVAGLGLVGVSACNRSPDVTTPEEGATRDSSSGDAPSEPGIDPTSEASLDPTSGGALAPNATVDRVVDGDTIVADVEGRSERVRLIGIDTPESVDENRPVQCYGVEASEHLAALLPPGTPITLIRDVEARDRYDRLLAYVVRSTDGLFVNLELVEGGYADSSTYPPNVYYAYLLEAAAASAADTGVGLWGACGGPDVPVG